MLRAKAFDKINPWPIFKQLILRYISIILTRNLYIFGIIRWNYVYYGETRGPPYLLIDKVLSSD